MLKLLFLIALGALMSGCTGVPKVRAMHDPLYRAEAHTSTITVRATEPQDGVAEIRIEAVVGELTACTGGVLQMPSLIPCRTGASATGLVCTFANAKSEVACSLPLNLTGRRLVTYTASARSGKNVSASTGAVTYAAGAPLTQVQIPFPFGGGINMAWETARPVIWRTDAPASTVDRSDKIDWGFVPDPDMPNYRAFTDDMQPMVLELFYTDNNAFSAWNRTWKNLFNIWAGPTGGNAEPSGAMCSRSFAAPASTVMSAFDGTVILHRNAIRDCSSITLGGGSGTAQTNLADKTWVMLHESGHFLFGLGDEYVGGGNFAVSKPKNVYADKATCESNATANSLPTSQCVQIGTTGTWRNDDGLPTTMEERVLNSDWRTLSGKAVNNMVTRCVGGACY